MPCVQHLQNKKATVKTVPITVEKWVAVTVWRLATQCEYRTIALLFGIDRIGLSTACKITHEACQAIVDILHPSTSSSQLAKDLPKSSKASRPNTAFRSVQEMDGTHTLISTPEAKHKDYHNRKGFTSIV